MPLRLISDDPIQRRATRYAPSVSSATSAKTFVFTASPSLIPLPLLVSFRYGIAFVNPVLTKVVGNVKDLHIREAHSVKFSVCGIDVWTFASGTAAAVKHDGLGVRQSSNPFAKLLKPLRARSSADVFRLWDVRLLIEHMKPNLQNERLVALGGLHNFGQLLRLNYLRGGTRRFGGHDLRFCRACRCGLGQRLRPCSRR